MVNVKAVFELEGTADDIDEWLHQHSFNAGRAVTIATAPAEPKEPYSAVVADQLVRRVTPDARRAVRYIAEHAPQAPWADVQQHMGMNGIRIGGVMASFGFAENAGIPRPYRNDRARRVYEMDAPVATVILEALDRFENPSGQTP